MQRAGSLRMPVFTGLMLALSVCGSGADPVARPDGALVEDFEDAKLEAYRPTTFDRTGNLKHAVVQRDGNRLLHLNQESVAWGKLWLEGEEYKDFTLEADIRKPAFLQGYAGVGFRDGMNAFFRMRGIVYLTADRPRAMLGQSIDEFPITEFHRLKVVCAGPIVRVYVNDRVVIEALDPAHDKAGPIALTTHSTGAYFDNVVITPRVAPEEAVMVEPWAEDDCLVFPPGRSALLQLKVANYSDSEQEVAYRVEVRDWDDAVVSEAREGTVRVASGQSPLVGVKLGALEQGYYQVVVASACGRSEATQSAYPLAVHEREAVSWKEPLIPLAPYWKYPIANLKPIVKKTYMHAAANLLRKHGFNAVVAGVGIDDVQVDVLKEYGLSVITRGLKCIEMESVIAGLIGDEPKSDDIENYKKQYDELRAKTEKPLTTCMIGEALFHALDYWEILEPELRAFRWYGFKKSYYNLRRRLDYKNSFSFVDTLVVASYDDTPYWVILPSFGGNGVHAYYRNPMPSELQAMMHLCLAHNAEGLLFFCLQPQGGSGMALVESRSLEPMDGKLAAIAEVNRLVQANERLLKDLRKVGFDVRTDSHAVEVQGLDLPERDAEEEAGQGTVQNRYFYAINIDNVETVECRLFNLPPDALYTDVYTGRKLEAAKETVELQPGSSYETGVIRVTLGPGRGMLVKVHEEWTRPEPIGYPAWLQTVPADKVVWLVDQPVLNNPQPGWLPQKPGSWQKKSWAEMNGDTTLYPDLYNPLGIECEKSLYAQAETIIEYAIPAGCTKFVAAAGLGNRDDRSSVVFRVLVDGEARFTSDVYVSGQPVMPLVVDVAGGRKLTLVTLPTDDGIGYDYAWWGSARLLKE